MATQEEVHEARYSRRGLHGHHRLPVRTGLLYHTKRNK